MSEAVKLTGHLSREAEAAAQLRESLTQYDDSDLIADMIEGETGLFEAIDIVLAEIAQEDAIAKGAKDMAETFVARSEAAKKRAGHLRATIEVALLTANLKGPYRRPAGTVGLRKGPDRLGDLDEAEIPSQFFKTAAPKLDRTGLLKALKDLPEGEVIPGAALEPGTFSLTIRRN